jgi:hypothetical protein
VTTGWSIYFYKASVDATNNVCSSAEDCIVCIKWFAFISCTQLFCETLLLSLSERLRPTYENIGLHFGRTGLSPDGMNKLMSKACRTDAPLIKLGLCLLINWSSTYTTVSTTTTTSSNHSDNMADLISKTFQYTATGGMKNERTSSVFSANKILLHLVLQSFPIQPPDPQLGPFPRPNHEMSRMTGKCHSKP